MFSKDMFRGIERCVYVVVGGSSNPPPNYRGAPGFLQYSGIRGGGGGGGGSSSTAMLLVSA